MTRNGQSDEVVVVPCVSCGNGVRVPVALVDDELLVMCVSCAFKPGDDAPDTDV